MKVRFWGTRGSVPTPGSGTAKYGGNTSCVSIQTADGTHIILDCGTGIRELGLDLIRSGQRPECNQAWSDSWCSTGKTKMASSTQLRASGRDCIETMVAVASGRIAAAPSR